jgi:hypothetical protein
MRGFCHVHWQKLTKYAGSQSPGLSGSCVWVIHVVIIVQLIWLYECTICVEKCYAMFCCNCFFAFWEGTHNTYWSVSKTDAARQ